MKAAKKAFFGLAAIGAIVFVSGVSFAETAAPAATPAAVADDVSAAKKARYEAKIKLLEDSAAALQATNPALAMKLTDTVNELSKIKAEGSKEKLAQNSPEWKARHDARIQLYKDAAAALQTTNPDLANSLMDLTVPPKQRAEMQKAAGEKVEPKGDK